MTDSQSTFLIANDLEGIKEEIKKHPAQAYYRPLSSLGFMDDSQDGRSDVIKASEE